MNNTIDLIVRAKPPVSVERRDTAKMAISAVVERDMIFGGRWAIYLNACEAVDISIYPINADLCVPFFVAPKSPNQASFSPIWQDFLQEARGPKPYDLPKRISVSTPFQIVGLTVPLGVMLTCAPFDLASLRKPFGKLK